MVIVCCLLCPSQLRCFSPYKQSLYDHFAPSGELFPKVTRSFNPVETTGISLTLLSVYFFFRRRRTTPPKKTKSDKVSETPHRVRSTRGSCHRYDRRVFFGPSRTGTPSLPHYTNRCVFGVPGDMDLGWTGVPRQTFLRTISWLGRCKRFRRGSESFSCFTGRVT